MLSYLTFSICDECFSASDLMKKLDKAIALFGNRIWLNKAFLLRKPISTNKLKILLYYKGVLDNLTYDPFYYGPKYSYEDIDSRIKELINALH